MTTVLEDLQRQAAFVNASLSSKVPHINPNAPKPLCPHACQPAFDNSILYLCKAASMTSCEPKIYASQTQVKNCFYNQQCNYYDTIFSGEKEGTQ